MSYYFAGIDGGQSSTVAVVADEQGYILGRGRAGGADEVGEGSDSTRLHDALRDALADACAHAKLTAGVVLESVVAGVSGYRGSIAGRTPELPARQFRLLHDAPIALAGALAEEPGIVVIAGTGSVVYGTGGARPWTGGGWGYLFGDEGSAFWMAREVLAGLMRAEDEGTPNDSEARAACEFFGLPSLRAIVHAFYAGELARERIAAFTPAASGFSGFSEIAGRGATHLGALVRAAIETGAVPAVALTGGAFTDVGYARRVGAAIRDASPAARVVAAKYEPSVGALLLAYREAGAGPFARIEDRT